MKKEMSEDEKEMSEDERKKQHKHTEKISNNNRKKENMFLLLISENTVLKLITFKLDLKPFHTALILPIQCTLKAC